jgi:NADH-quinone oxidoreductase subunit L
MEFVTQNSWLIPLLPLVAAIVVGLFGRKVLKGQSHWPIWAGVFASAVMAFVLLYGMVSQTGAHAEPVPADPTVVADVPQGAAVGSVSVMKPTIAYANEWFTWFSAGSGDARITVSAGALIDPLTGVMLCVVCGIGFLITVFAAGYMKGESGYWRFFAYLGLFIFSMTCLVMGDNLVMLYLGWEGVGLCSYLLIGYYYQKPAAREAAKKAFIVNRIGDFGFAVGIMLVWYCYGTVSFFGNPAIATDGFIDRIVNGSPNAGTEHLVYWIPFCLMLGAFGKSAQFPLHVWLPDAMEGPTPVSALIHAATMVTAGVYMIARCGPVFTGNEDAMLVVAIIGCITALLGGAIALKQYDLKKVFAYSTVSQLGFMFVAVGSYAPVSGVFHLVTHAFFKALLFLASGVVMHAMLGHLDLRKMSGIRKQLPLTTILCGIGCLALAGFPIITAGYWSKDEIIHAAGMRHTMIMLMLMVTALATAYYTFRVYFRVFWGENVVPNAAADDDHGAAPDTNHGHDHADHHHSHEPMLMIAPLAVLAIGALAAGLLNLPFSVAGLPAHWLGSFLGQSGSFQAGFAGAMNAGAFNFADPEGLSAAALMFGQHIGETHVETAGLIIGAVIAIAGIVLAWFFHLANRPLADNLAKQGVFVIAGRWLYNKLYIDELYNGLVSVLRFGSGVLHVIDDWIIDGVVFLVAGFATAESLLLKNTIQRGYLQGYALAAIIGIALILGVVFVL